MNNLLDGIFIIVMYYLFFCILMLPIAICEHFEKKRNNKAKRNKEQRRFEYEQECERLGRKMINEDNIRKVLAENTKIKKMQTIKYTGYFSGQEVEKMMAKMF